eukprot:3144126-Rhodomonas_salina.2
MFASVTRKESAERYAVTMRSQAKVRPHTNTACASRVGNRSAMILPASSSAQATSLQCDCLPTSFLLRVRVTLLHPQPPPTP